MTRMNTSHSQRLNGKAVSTGLRLIVSNRDIVIGILKLILAKNYTCIVIFYAQWEKH